MFRRQDVGIDVPLPNHYFILRSPSHSALAWFNPVSGLLERVQKMPAYGITPRNAEQTFALHAIMNPAVPLVSITGKAGTGKTLLALAGALEQRKAFRQVYLARPLVPLSNKDIGYLPGDIKSKVNPYMQPLWDNLNIIKHQFDERDREFRRIDEMVEQEKLHITPLAYIRGRELLEHHLHRRRSAESDAARSPHDHHPRRRGHQDHLHRRHLPDRHAVPRCPVERTLVPDRSHQGAQALRPRFAREGRAQRAREPREHDALDRKSERARRRDRFAPYRARGNSGLQRAPLARAAAALT